MVQRESSHGNHFPRSRQGRKRGLASTSHGTMQYMPCKLTSLLGSPSSDVGTKDVPQKARHCIKRKSWQRIWCWAQFVDQSFNKKQSRKEKVSKLLTQTICQRDVLSCHHLAYNSSGTTSPIQADLHHLVALKKTVVQMVMLSVWINKSFKRRSISHVCNTYASTYIFMHLFLYFSI